jgi:hypothetical protein
LLDMNEACRDGSPSVEPTVAASDLPERMPIDGLDEVESSRRRRWAVVAGLHPIAGVVALDHLPPRYTVAVPPKIDAIPVSSTGSPNRSATIEGVLDPIEPEAAETRSPGSRLDPETRRSAS